MMQNPGQSPEETWKPLVFFRVTPFGPMESRGYGCRGLALRHLGWANPRADTRWQLFHIGSGGCVVEFTGSVMMVFPVAQEIADCGDWTLFDMPDGWRQTDPDLPRKCWEILDAHPELRPRNLAVETGPVSAEEARAVVAAREAVQDGVPVPS